MLDVDEYPERNVNVKNTPIARRNILLKTKDVGRQHFHPLTDSVKAMP